MKSRGWQWPLEEGETLLWEGRPAPRCFTFRRWKPALLATLLFLASSFWMMLGYQLVSSGGYPFWIMLLPVPLVLLSLWFGPCQLALARLRWEKVFYALTDRHLIERNGLFSASFTVVPLGSMRDWQEKKISGQLSNLRLRVKGRAALVFYCIEQPQNLLSMLTERAVTQSDSQPESV